MSDYWQVIRRLPEGGHQSISDWHDKDAAKASAALLNRDFQTNEHAVIHRTTEGFASSLSRWWDGKL